MAEHEVTESFERCDTDGFLSQWAHGVCAQEDRLAARIKEDGGKAEFPGLFDLSGNLVPAKLVESRFGWSWMLLNDRGRCAGWFNESKARSAEARAKNNAKKGYYVGTVRVPAYAALQGRSRTSVSAVALRADNGWSADAEIVNNGQA